MPSSPILFILHLKIREVQWFIQSYLFKELQILKLEYRASGSSWAMT